jgi:uncharacterized membrane protein
MENNTLTIKDDVLKRIIMIASILGSIDAVYLTIEKITHNKAMCLPGLGDCWTVSNSPYSQIFGIPVAVFGLGAYLFILILLKSESIYPNWKDSILMGTFGLALSGTIYSIYLTYLEIAVIKAICPFCVISALVMLTIFICTILRLANNQSEFKSQFGG